MRGLCMIQLLLPYPGNIGSTTYASGGLLLQTNVDWRLTSSTSIGYIWTLVRIGAGGNSLEVHEVQN